MDNMKEYLKFHYGTCSKKPKCICLETEWIGDLCPYWYPTKARNWDEYREEIRKLYKK